MQRAERLAVPHRPLGGNRAFARLLGGERDDRVQRGIEPRDDGEMRIENLDRADLARRDQVRQLARGFAGQAGVGHFPDQWTKRRSTRRNSRLRP